jgi:hypothetical protein
MNVGGLFSNLLFSGPIFHRARTFPMEIAASRSPGILPSRHDAKFHLYQFQFPPKPAKHVNGIDQVIDFLVVQWDNFQPLRQVQDRLHIPAAAIGRADQSFNILSRHLHRVASRFTLLKSGPACLIDTPRLIRDSEDRSRPRLSLSNSQEIISRNKKYGKKEKITIELNRERYINTAKPGAPLVRLRLFEQ